MQIVIKRDRKSTGEATGKQKKVRELFTKMRKNSNIIDNYFIELNKAKSDLGKAKKQLEIIPKLVWLTARISFTNAGWT